MNQSAYLSNISPLWPLERQEKALATALPGWPNGVRVFRDVLDVRARRGHHPDSLVQRAAMLRPSTRNASTEASTETITLPSLAPLAWTMDDAMRALSLAASRGATVRVLDADLTITRSSGADVMHRAAEAFAAARKADRARTGGKVSGENRAAKAKAKAELLSYEWGLPSSLYHTDALCGWVGISLNTAKQYLGPRPAAQRKHLTAIKRRKTA